MHEGEDETSIDSYRTATQNNQEAADTIDHGIGEKRRSRTIVIVNHPGSFAS